MSDNKDKVIYLKGKPQVPSPEDDKAEALRTMTECLSIVSAKIDSEQVDGMIVITFNKDSTSEDYLVGQLNMSEVTHVLQCLLINNVMMTQIDFRDLE